MSKQLHEQVFESEIPFYGNVECTVKGVCEMRKICRLIELDNPQGKLLKTEFICATLR